MESKLFQLFFTHLRQVELRFFAHIPSISTRLLALVLVEETEISRVEPATGRS